MRFALLFLLAFSIHLSLFDFSYFIFGASHAIEVSVRRRCSCVNPVVISSCPPYASGSDVLDVNGVTSPFFFWPSCPFASARPSVVAIIQSPPSAS